MSKSNAFPVTGVKVHSYSVRSSKDTERLKIILEADISDITADMGDVQKSLLIHKQSDTEVGLKLFASKVGALSVPSSDDDDEDDFDV